MLEEDKSNKTYFVMLFYFHTIIHCLGLDSRMSNGVYFYIKHPCMDQTDRIVEIIWHKNATILAK